MMRLSPVTWGVIALGLIALPASLLLPDDRATPAQAVERPLPEAPAAADLDDTGRADKPAPAPPRLVSIDRLTETSARPLFAPTRRPAPPAPPVVEAPLPVAEAPPEPPPPPVERTDYALVGIVSGRDGALAVLRPRDGGAAVTVRAGDDVGGWHVEAVSGTGIHLSGDGDDRWMRLFAPQHAAGSPANADDDPGRAVLQ